MGRWARVGKFKVRRVPVPDAVRVVRFKQDDGVWTGGEMRMPASRIVFVEPPPEFDIEFANGFDDLIQGSLAHHIDKPRAQSPGTTTKPRTDRIGPREAVERRVAAARDEIRDPLGELCEELMAEATL